MWHFKKKTNTHDARVRAERDGVGPQWDASTDEHHRLSPDLHAPDKNRSHTYRAIMALPTPVKAIARCRQKKFPGVPATTADMQCKKMPKQCCVALNVLLQG